MALTKDIEEMRSPFEEIKEVDGEGREWQGAIIRSDSKNSNSFGQLRRQRGVDVQSGRCCLILTSL